MPTVTDAMLDGRDVTEAFLELGAFLRRTELGQRLSFSGNRGGGRL
jgi:hypothetical protein